MTCHILTTCRQPSDSPNVRPQSPTGRPCDQWPLRVGGCAVNLFSRLSGLHSTLLCVYLLDDVVTRQPGHWSLATSAITSALFTHRQFTHSTLTNLSMFLSLCLQVCLFVRWSTLTLTYDGLMLWMTLLKIFKVFLKHSTHV